MLYTTYLARIKKIPEGVEKLLVVRIPPKHFDFEKNKDVRHTPELSPTKTLLMHYKESDDWNFYVRRFKREMESREDLKNALKKLTKTLESGKSVCLICFEKDYKHCHRYLIAEKMIEKGFEWREI